MHSRGGVPGVAPCRWSPSPVTRRVSPRPRFSRDTRTCAAPMRGRRGARMTPCWRSCPPRTTGPAPLGARAGHEPAMRCRACRSATPCTRSAAGSMGQTSCAWHARTPGARRRSSAKVAAACWPGRRRCACGTGGSRGAATVHASRRGGGRGRTPPTGWRPGGRCTGSRGGRHAAARPACTRRRRPRGVAGGASACLAGPRHAAG